EVLVRKLTDRAHSRADLGQALAQKQVPAEVAEAVLDKFEAAGLINDGEFARSWVQSRQRSKGLARNVLAMELRRKGVDEEIAQEALSELDPDVERQAAHQLVQKKLRTMRGLDQQVQIRRLTGLLARKGYSPQVAFDVVREELDVEAQALESL
ncbi:MAG: recombination regulator RecX, partial [Actinomycetota bacterium]|nr:recombination regulator RecX [Actinomycetota bacterium]